ncbi:roadblock/LC7 domain-containing protein [Dactylosporangium darangshiense]|uniref:Roadblock/LC7 domain-containing protein n=2 Tax=Dactylosporangium darangshiense TaxID=579108 RepID=A0ABP8DTJ4_9ACTN
MLNDLVQIEHVTHALVLSTDGMIVQKSTSLAQEAAEILAAGASSMYSVAAGTGKRLDTGALDQVVIEYTDQILFTAAAGPNARLAVMCEQAVDMGTVAYEMRRMVTRIGEYLGTEARSAVPAANLRPSTGHGV